jgi:hypothetical protein
MTAPAPPTILDDGPRVMNIAKADRAAQIRAVTLNAPKWVIALARKPEFPSTNQKYLADNTWQDCVGEHVIMMWDTFSTAQRCAIILDADALFQASESID